MTYLRTLTRSCRRRTGLTLVLVGLAITLGLPTAASAAKPAVTTSDVVSTGESTATVHGTVNPEGKSTTFHVEWDFQSSDWCTSGGASGSPANATSAASLPFADSTAHDVSVDLSGLAFVGYFCARLVAQNGDGEADGGQVAWKQSLPRVHTFDAFMTGNSTAAVEGDFNPGGLGTSYWVEYDLASSDWCTSGGTSPTAPPPHSTDPQLGFADATFHDVSIHLDVTPGLGYCAWLVVNNSSGEVHGAQVTWEQSPGVTTDYALQTGASTAKVEGEVDPGGETTSYQVQYDLIGSAWCTSGGSSGTPAHTTPSTQLGSTDAFFHHVSVDLSGLTEQKAYCAQLIATNASGERAGGRGTWPQKAHTKCLVPKLKGKTLASARKAIDKAHCSVGKVTKVKSSPENKGRVISQSPKPGKHLPKGSKVALKLGK